MRFRIFDHRDGQHLAESDSFDQILTRAKVIHEDQPGRFLEVQRWDLDRTGRDAWIPTGWTYGVAGTWD